ncbi:MAG TPA: extracellular solute-binding protein [Candidatus Atribacteria bacterium]|nr:extracellular solute-binding protein [Candidatus Atribacteria bacterium]
MKKLSIFLMLILLFTTISSIAFAGDTVIKFWHTYNMQTEEGKTMNEVVIPAFEKEHPGVKVESLQIPYDEFRKKLLTSIAGGKAPDIVRVDIIWVPEMAKEGLLTNLSQEFGEEFDKYKSKVFPGPLSTNYYNGSYYGIPLDTNTRVMMWNKKLFQAAGINNPPTTFTEFKEVVKKLTKDTDGDGKIDQWGAAIGSLWPWHILPWIWSNGGSVTNSGLTKSTGYLNSPESVGALQLLVDLYKDGYMSETIVGGGEDTGAGYGNDHYGMIFGGPWFWPIIKGQFPEKELDFALYPHGEGAQSVSVVGGENMIIPTTSKHKDIAWEFAKYLLSEDVQVKMAKTGQIPVVSSVVDTKYFKSHPYFGIFMEQLKTANARTVHPQWNRIKEELHKAFEAAILGKMTSQEALDKASNEIDKILKMK